jgi:hypothetical protein
MERLAPADSCLVHSAGFGEGLPECTVSVDYSTIAYWVFKNMSRKHTSRPVGATGFLLEVGMLLT